MSSYRIKFHNGSHCHADFAEEHLTPHFESGTIAFYQGADYYAVCGGVLCAYKDSIGRRPQQTHLLATWSTPVPDCEAHVSSDQNYVGEWKKHH